MNPKAAAGLVLAAAFLALTLAALAPASLTWPSVGPTQTGVGQAMWSGRTFEVLVQGLLLLGGALAVLLLGRHRVPEAGP